MKIWLFCQVIDNFGDAGVAYRLARILVDEYQAQVSVWIDEKSTLSALSGNTIDAQQVSQNHRGVAWHLWNKLSTWEDNASPDAVLELFACNLPDAVRAIIKKNNALWLNWEYLTAEDWATALHLMPSPQPDGNHKLFYFMGFSEKTGGLLREKTLKRLPVEQIKSTESLSFYVFGYEHPTWQYQLEAWRHLPIRVYRAGKFPQSWLNCSDIETAPFVAQEDFDALLATYDVLFVRGEDSFVRAQFSGKPFFWQIYPQENNAHHAKLHAFWNQVYQFFPNEIKILHQQISDDINGVIHLSPPLRLKIWQQLLNAQTLWHNAHVAWCDFLFSQSSAQQKLLALLEDKKFR